MSSEGGHALVPATNPPYQHHPQSTDACTNIVQSLLCHSCGDSDFSRRAIESLVKKMKEKRDELDALITAITTGGAVQTACVTIQRTLDGRLQVAGRKGFPNVIYARIWRWPDLTRNELRPTKNCAHAFKEKSDLICVNPYHYDRVVVSPGIDLSSLSINSPDDAALTQLNLHSGSPPINNNLPICNALPSSPSAIAMGQQQSISHCMDPSHSPNIDGLPMHPAPIAPSHHLNHHHPHPQQPQPQQMQHQIPPPSNQHHPVGPLQPLPPHQVNPNTANFSSPPTQYLSQPMPEYWCSISYFELDQQVGETFRVSSSYPSVTVDGYTNPSAADRFCIGFLSNVHRPQTVQKARLHIGKGIRLESTCEGDVWLMNLSDNAVFLSSPYLDQKSGRQPGNAVHKIYPTTNLKVFDLRETHILLSKKAEAARQAAADQALLVAGTQPVGREVASGDKLAEAIAEAGVDKLRSFCILSMSFVKGWGLDYPRNNIKDCPCWVEVQLHRALQLLDEVLQLKL